MSEVLSSGMGESRTSTCTRSEPTGSEPRDFQNPEGLQSVQNPSTDRQMASGDEERTLQQVREEELEEVVAGRGPSGGDNGSLRLRQVYTQEDLLRVQDNCWKEQYRTLCRVSYFLQRAYDETQKEKKRLQEVIQEWR